jgi:hypothetical protein
MAARSSRDAKPGAALGFGSNCTMPGVVEGDAISIDRLGNRATVLSYNSIIT